MSISRRADRGNRWQARYRDDTGHEYARLFDRKVDAKRWLDETTAAIVTGQYVRPEAGRVTFKTYAEAWRVAQVHRPTTQAHHKTQLDRHIYPTFGDRPISAIRPSEIQAWVTGLSATLQPATVGVIHSIAASIFKAAIRDRKLMTSPCEGTKLPKEQPREVVPLSTETVETLADAVGERYRALVILAAGTGMRQGECFGLTANRIDFLRRSLRVDRQLILLPRVEPYLAEPKTRASNRTIPLPQVVRNALAAHIEAFPAIDDALVFTTDSGAPLRRTDFSVHVWRPAVAKAKAPAGTRFHDLRHYYASLLIRHGESVKTVQMRLGHASAAETLDTYSHLWPDSEDRTREAIDAVLGHSDSNERSVQ
jgi:integrase